MLSDDVIRDEGTAGGEVAAPALDPVEAIQLGGAAVEQAAQRAGGYVADVLKALEDLRHDLGQLSMALEGLAGTGRSLQAVAGTLQVTAVLVDDDVAWEE